MIILDTDAITFLERHGSIISQQLQDRLTLLSTEHDIATTIVTYDEQTRGWFAEMAKARDIPSLIKAYDNLFKHLTTFREIDVLPFTVSAGNHFERLRSLKLKVGTKDLRIAAIALEHQATVLTRNVHDFAKVPNLRVEDWTKL
jgi:tRNA(fMet)-specific endonuclease VapC